MGDARCELRDARCVFDERFVGRYVLGENENLRKSAENRYS